MKSHLLQNLSKNEILQELITCSESYFYKATTKWHPRSPQIWIHFNFWNITAWKQMTLPGDSPDLGYVSALTWCVKSKHGNTVGNQSKKLLNLGWTQGQQKNVSFTDVYLLFLQDIQTQKRTAQTWMFKLTKAQEIKSPCSYKLMFLRISHPALLILW